MNRVSDQLSQVSAYVAPRLEQLSASAKQAARNLSQLAVPLIALIVLEQVVIANAQPLCTDTAMCRFGCAYGKDIISNKGLIEACFSQCAALLPCK